MKKISLYHNPRCSKSRKAVEILNEMGVKYDIIEYIKTPLSKIDLTNLLNKLDMDAISIIRMTEKEFKASNLDNGASENELIDFILEHPKVLQRPIISKDKKAVIGRPPENIYKLLNEE